MKRLGLVIVGSALAFTLSTSGAMAVSHPCNIDDHPDQAAADADNCIGSPEYIQALRDAGQDTEIGKKVDSETQTGVDSGQDGEIGKNRTAIGEWNAQNPETPDRETVRREIEKNDVDIETNARDIITNDLASRARDEALGRRIDKNSEAIEDAIALSAAIPDSWLSDSENFAISLGGGFTDGSSAFGGIGTFRINKNLSAYGGGSTLTDGGTWAAKGGVRLGW